MIYNRLIYVPNCLVIRFPDISTQTLGCTTLQQLRGIGSKQINRKWKDCGHLTDENPGLIQQDGSDFSNF